MAYLGVHVVHSDFRGTDDSDLASDPFIPPLQRTTTKVTRTSSCRVTTTAGKTDYYIEMMTQDLETEILL